MPVPPYATSDRPTPSLRVLEDPGADAIRLIMPAPSQECIRSFGVGFARLSTASDRDHPRLEDPLGDVAGGATGYQYVRAEDALQVQLRAFLAEELRDWEKTFPDELWQEFGRLTGWSGPLHSRPKWWG